MTREEALIKLDEAIENKRISRFARDDYASLCETSKGCEAFERILYLAEEQERKSQLRKAKKIARRNKEAV